MKARQIFHHKAHLHEHYIVELEIFEIGDPVRYPDGIKYSLLCMDTRNGHRVLLDNHHPKGPHMHLDETENAYVFNGVSALMADFTRIVLEHLGVKL